MRLVEKKDHSDQAISSFSRWFPKSITFRRWKFNITELKKIIIFVLHQLWYLGHAFFGAADRGYLSTRGWDPIAPTFFKN